MSFPLEPHLGAALMALVFLAGPYLGARFSPPQAPPEILRLLRPPALIGVAIALRQALSYFGWEPRAAVWGLYGAMIGAAVWTVVVWRPFEWRIVRRPP
ncbi:MAG: hypothetical protein NVS1B4_24680 [Gemmatimonadaceae bacterium]